MEKGYKSAIDGGYANLSALAKLIKPTIDALLGQDVKLSTIVTALKRMRERPLEKRLATARVIAKSKLEAKTGLAKIILKRNKASLRIARDLAVGPRGFFQLLDGITSITLICSQERLEEVKREFPRSLFISEKGSIAALIIVSPAIIEKTHGVVSYMLEWLALKEVNVEEVVSCYKDTIILVATEDGGKAFDALNELIMSCRRIVSKS
ncbi:MAG: hypothetical protein RMJ28_02025 [Nitrososphaerota archaeon]|nr:ACT domain-containing protein [Candidatus Calditenuaceae archaeon]MDW8073001.1 hypothetical protein [Nitrososphaerota archaeon]